MAIEKKGRGRGIHGTDKYQGQGEKVGRYHRLPARVGDAEEK
jgi:hypothetical protein